MLHGKAKAMLRRRRPFRVARSRRQTAIDLPRTRERPFQGHNIAGLAEDMHSYKVHFRRSNGNVMTASFSLQRGGGFFNCAADT